MPSFEGMEALVAEVWTATCGPAKRAPLRARIKTCVKHAEAERVEGVSPSKILGGWVGLQKPSFEAI